MHTACEGASLCGGFVLFWLLSFYLLYGSKHLTRHIHFQKRKEKGWEQLCLNLYIQISCDIHSGRWNPEWEEADRSSQGAEENMWTHTQAFCLLVWGAAHLLIRQQWLMPLGSSDGADSSPLSTQDTAQAAAWYTFPPDTTMSCTWTSSKMVACSWLVSVVRCFWSSNFVLDEFIPIGKREGDNRSMGDV